MDVDPSFFSLIVRASKDEIFEPTREQLLQLNVLNNGRTRARWTMESHSGVIYLKGEQDSIFGLNKFMLFCSNSDLVLYVVFDPQGREDEVMKFDADFLMIDGKRVRIDKARAFRTVNNDGLIHAMYKLERSHIALIAKSKEVGLAMSPSVDSQVFLGFAAIPFEEGAAKLPGLLKTCR